MTIDLSRRALLATAAGSALGARAQVPEARNDAAPAREGPGYAVPIGGALKYDNAEVWNRLVQLAQAAGGASARFAVLATAAGNPDRSAALIVDALQRHGGQAEHIRVAPRIKDVDLAAALRDPALAERVGSAAGVFFAGGAQERIVDTLLPAGQATPLLEAVRHVQRKGGVVAGTSAGAAVMSRVMFRDAQDVMAVLKGRLRDGLEIDRGLGFVGPELFVDQHFLKRGRFGRMLPLMIAKGYTLGLGVDENSAAIVHGDDVEVIGAKGALLVDLSSAKSDRDAGAFNLQGARLTYLDRGDRYNLKTRATLPSPEKLRDARVDPNAADFKPYFDNNPFYLDMLGDTVIANAMANLIDNGRREARGLAYNARPRDDDRQPDLGFEFRLYKGADSMGWFTGAFGGEDYTVSNLYLDVQPVRLATPLYTPWVR